VIIVVDVGVCAFTETIVFPMPISDALFPLAEVDGGDTVASFAAAATTTLASVILVIFFLAPSSSTPFLLFPPTLARCVELNELSIELLRLRLRLLLWLLRVRLRLEAPAVASAAGMSVNDVVVEALSARFVPFP